MDQETRRAVEAYRRTQAGPIENNLIDEFHLTQEQVADRVGNSWVIAEGLKRGDRVVAEGVQKVHPGMPVSPKPFAPGTADTKGK